MFNILRNTTSDMWRMHDLNYKLQKEAKQDYWNKVCADHPTSAHCEVYLSLNEFKILKRQF